VDCGAAGPAVAVEERLDPLPDILADNGRVLTLVDLVFVRDLADVRDVGEQLVQSRLGELPAPALVPLSGDPSLVDPAAAVEFLDDRDQGMELQVQLEYDPDANRLVLVDDQRNVSMGLRQLRDENSVAR
jgi:hypothetical protein